MSTERHHHDHDEPDQGEDCAPAQTDCVDCDPDLIDELTCQAQGIAAQAEYNAQTQPVLRQAGLDYSAARAAYRTARSAATLEVQDLRHQVKQLIERIRCQIKQDDIADCLDRAYRRICRQLDDCGGGGGCCTDEECSVDKTCPDDYDELVSRIAEYQGRLEREKACFVTLVAEPAALTARVAAVKAEIDAINADLTGDQASVDLKKVYVAALVAQRHLHQVWAGFAQTRDYMDCLCRTLTCWTRTTDAVSALIGCKAIKDCQQKARQDRCEALATQTVDEVLLEFERLCGNEPCPEPQGEDDCQDSSDEEDDDAGDDCGCGHGHRHNRGHHDHAHSHESGS